VHRFSCVLIAAAATIAFAPVATATDLPVKAPVNARVPRATPLDDWSGFYLGGHLGHIWGHTRVEDDGVITEHNARTNGVTGGALAGYNWQNGALVLGIDGDFGWSNARGTGSGPPPDPDPVVFVTTQAPNIYDLNWTTHVRGRVGYALNDWLFYLAGGFALADLTFQEGAITTAQVSGGKYYGWLVGGGVEHAFTRHLVGRIEYLYDDFGHKDYAGVAGDVYRVFLTGQTVRGALAWKFDPIK
jgi:outer membrane immunogenic protein